MYFVDELFGFLGHDGDLVGLRASLAQDERLRQKLDVLPQLLV